MPTLQLTASIKENPRLRAAAEELRKQGVMVGDAVGEALRTMEESELVRAVRLSLSPLCVFSSPSLSADIPRVRRRRRAHRYHDRASPEHGGVQGLQ
jgi:hypothetical protein